MLLYVYLKGVNKKNTLANSSEYEEGHQHQKEVFQRMLIIFQISKFEIVGIL